MISPDMLWTVSLCVLGVLIFLCLLRVLRGPRVADRLLGINMISTLVILILCVLSLLLQEDYLTDVALLLSLLGCLAAVVLTRVLAQRRPGEAGRTDADRPGKGGAL